LKPALVFVLLASISAAAQAQDAPEPSDQPPLVDAPAPVVQAPAVSTVVVPRDWRGVFDAIDRGNWASARAGIAALPASPLASLAKAELYTARNSPAVDLQSLLALITEAPELPQASQLAAMAVKRGATTAPAILTPRRVVGLGSAPVRYRARPVQGDPAADQLRSILDQLVKTDDAAAAEAQLLTFAPSLTAEGRAEAGQRVAFIYYIRGLDLDARRVADTWRQGATGEWAAQAAWTSGLASWRMSDFNTASQSFQQAARLATQRELRAGAYYWAARSEQAAGRPRSVTPLLRYAAESPESFYGLVARETLGLDTKLPRDPFVGFDPPVDHLPNVRRANELVHMGRHGQAEELLRHQAKVGLPTEHHALIQVAKKLDLPAAQLWLANNGQQGARSDAADRYPNPRWTPPGGWRVDPALAFGHVIQESAFRRAAVSPVGAVGLMQVRPGTAGDFARARGTALGSLTDVSLNLEYGQSFIELMRRNPGTAGQLPRVIASYNAGPVPVSRWAAIYDKGDPLLWIESIPYWETRYYVPSILRNMWVYQGLNGRETPTLRELAQHRWPAFPAGMTTLAH
jgi:soluble lytic murein transglycosylase-like protein